MENNYYIAVATGNPDCSYYIADYRFTVDDEFIFFNGTPNASQARLFTSRGQAESVVKSIDELDLGLQLSVEQQTLYHVVYKNNEGSYRYLVQLTNNEGINSYAINFGEKVDAMSFDYFVADKVIGIVNHFLDTADVEISLLEVE